VRYPAIVIDPVDIPAFDTESFETDSFDTEAFDTEAVTYHVDDLDLSSVRRYEQSYHTPAPTPKELPRNPSAGRVASYLANTKGATRQLADLFTRFDLDSSGTLSWDEVEQFQKYVFRNYTYFRSQTALSPQDFQARGGGDCKAFSLISAEFFRFWGWTAWVATFFNSTAGHAICVVRADSTAPARYYRFHFTGRKTVEGDQVPDGDYVPIDYDIVGGFSTALEAGMKMRDLFTPRKIYGVVL